MKNNNRIEIETGSKRTVIRIPDNASSTIELPNTRDVLIIAGKQSRATIIDKMQKMHNVEIFMKENSIIIYNTINSSSSKKAVIGKNASVKWMEYYNKNSVSSTTSILDGIGAESKILGIFLHDSGKTQITTNSIHKASRTNAEIIIRGVLNQSAKNVYKALVRVDTKALQCKSSQEYNALLIGNESEAVAFPVIEIENDDVECRHAVSIGKIDKEKIFYLMSRGLTEGQAKNVMIKGFFEHILNRMDPNIRMNLSEMTSIRGIDND